MRSVHALPLLSVAGQPSVLEAGWGPSVDGTKLFLAVGGFIRWHLNVDADPHSITCFDTNDGLVFSTGLLLPGSTYSLSFPTAISLACYGESFRFSMLVSAVPITTQATSASMQATTTAAPALPSSTAPVSCPGGFGSLNFTLFFVSPGDGAAGLRFANVNHPPSILARTTYPLNQSLAGARCLCFNECALASQACVGVVLATSSSNRSCTLLSATGGSSQAISTSESWMLQQPAMSTEPSSPNISTAPSTATMSSAITSSSIASQPSSSNTMSPFCASLPGWMVFNSSGSGGFRFMNTNNASDRVFQSVKLRTEIGFFDFRFGLCQLSACLDLLTDVNAFFNAQARAHVEPCISLLQAHSLSARAWLREEVE